MAETPPAEAKSRLPSSEASTNAGEPVTTSTMPLMYSERDFDPIFLRKAAILNDAIQEIGMGKYQWGLFAVLGGGWLADTLWQLVVSLILPSVTREFAEKRDGNWRGEYLELGEAIGLLVGVIFWGIGSDVWGRRISFNITLGITGVFAISGTGAKDGVALSALAAIWAIGVGGNLPVDSAIFLESVPPSHQYLLSTLSVWWAIGSLVAALLSWPLINNFTCPEEDSVCNKENNSGWRYVLFAMGGIMLLLWGIRFFAFKLYQPPKFSMGIGNDEDAVKAVHKIAAYNKTTSSLTLEQLEAVGKIEGLYTGTRGKAKTTFSHLGALFASRTMARATINLIILWACIGAGTALYDTYMIEYLVRRGADVGDGSNYLIFRNQIIQAVIGIPGAVMAGSLVNVPFLGRKGTLALAAVLTGTFTFASTTARTEPATLGFACAYIFTYNIMNGVLYAFTAEIFPTPARGSGNAVAATCNRIFGIMGPLLAVHADLNEAAPVWVAGALFFSSAIIVMLVPFEPRGRASA